MVDLRQESRMANGVTTGWSLKKVAGNRAVFAVVGSPWNYLSIEQ